MKYKTIDERTKTMPLRDYFAGQALIAFARSYDVEQYHSNPGNTGIIAKKCYRLADAMLRVRTEKI